NPLVLAKGGPTALDSCFRGHERRVRHLDIGINNNSVAACPWGVRLRARGNTGSDCKIRGCPRSPPARTFRRLANCNCKKTYRRPYSCPRTTAFDRLGRREGRATLPLLRSLR